MESSQASADSQEYERRRKRAEDLLLSAGGRVAEEVAAARGYRWRCENEERGKAELFERKLDLYQMGRGFFLRWLYLATLEQGLADAAKFLLLADREAMTVRFDFRNTPTRLRSFEKDTLPDDAWNTRDESFDLWQTDDFPHVEQQQ
jgi:hypothetical protein